MKNVEKLPVAESGDAKSFKDHWATTHGVLLSTGKWPAFSLPPLVVSDNPPPGGKYIGTRPNSSLIGPAMRAAVEVAKSAGQV